MWTIEVYPWDAEYIDQLCEEHDLTRDELIHILLEAVESGDIDIR